MIEPLTSVVKPMAIELLVLTCLNDLGLSQPGIEPIYPKGEHSTTKPSRWETIVFIVFKISKYHIFK